MAGPSDSPFISATATKSGVVNLGSISGLREWQFFENDPKQGDRPQDALTVTQAYSRVPWLYRAVNLRANTLADIPWVIVKGNTEVITSDKDDERTLPPELQWIKPITGTKSDPTQDSLVDLLRKAETDLCLHAAAYWKRDSNRTIAKSYRRWLPSTITPRFDKDAGLLGFTRRVPGNDDKEFTIDDIVFWWLAGVDAELGPGVAPAAVALRAAGLMSNIDNFGEGFFSRGAINTTILTVEGNPPDAELRRLENWWSRLMDGVRNAFKAAAIRASVKPVVVGQPPKDLALDTLTEAKRHDIATAMGVPMSVLDDRSANFATAKVSLTNFFRLTMLPEAEIVEAGLNRQVFGPLGLEFRFKTSEIESLQAEEDLKAYEMLALVIGGCITPNELREELDKEPLDGGDELRQPPVVGLAGDAAGQSPHTNGRMANEALGSAPRNNRQTERQLANNLGTTGQGRGVGKALEVLEMADVFAALAPPQQPTKAQRIRRIIERDDEGRIIGVTEVPEPEVATLVETFPDDEEEQYP